MPEIKYCRDCHKMFQYVTGPVLCPICKQREEEEFDKVRNFLRDFPGANMREVSENTEVHPNKISRWLREGRLEVSEDSPVALNCEKCGVRIRSGRFCMECSKGLAKEMMDVGQKLRQDINESSPRKTDRNVDKDEFGLYYKHKDQNK